jgi:hypothetical protein
MAMRRFGLKAVLTFLALNRSSNKRFNFERAFLILSTTVTIGLAAFYVFEKATSRW